MSNEKINREKLATGQEFESGLTKPHKKALGYHGETLAANYLVDAGMQIIARNWRVRTGELDIIAQDGDTLVAVEVKTRTGIGYGSGLESITQDKVARLRKLTTQWLSEQETRFHRVRIDAVSVLLRYGKEPEITHLRGVQ